MRRIRAHLTYANVISTLCLFLVLGGGTAAALSGSNTVFSDDIVNDQVYSADVRNDSQTGGGLAAVDLRAGSVGSSEVANNSLSGVDINESLLGTVPNADKLEGIDSSGFLAANAKAADADQLDGIDSSGFLGASAKAADADQLDGIDSSGFLGASAKAADADQLDGLNSTEFARLVVGGAYLGLPVKATTGAPPAADCDAANETGRAVYGVVDDFVWVCAGGVWRAH